VLARAIHAWGQQPEGPFISIDCAARSPAYVDLILFGDVVSDDPSLVLPHPRFRERRFVLEPLAEIGASLVDPATGRTVADLLAACVAP